MRGTNDFWHPYCRHTTDDSLQWSEQTHKFIHQYNTLPSHGKRKRTGSAAPDRVDARNRQRHLQEFVLDFIAALPGLPQARVNARQILTPESAKRLLFALQDNVVKYENEFGTIDLGTPQPAATEGVGRTATPFGAPDAKA